MAYGTSAPGVLTICSCSFAEHADTDLFLRPSMSICHASPGGKPCFLACRFFFWVLAFDLAED